MARPAGSPATATRRDALAVLASGIAAAAASSPGTAARPRVDVSACRDAPFSSALSEERRAGLYRCSRCGFPLFDARSKYVTSTGWPTFSRPLSGAVLTSPGVDPGALSIRCANCSCHLGDAFALRHEITKVRFSLNGTALTFAPDANASKRTCMSTISRITSGDELKRRNGEGDGAWEPGDITPYQQRPGLPVTFWI